MMQLPDTFLKEMECQFGKEETDRLIRSLNEEACVSIRLNPRLTPHLLYSESKRNLPIEDQVPWCELGWYLRERPVFTLDPLFHAGAYYVQEASSMYLWKILKGYVSHQPILALDMCAAPGGKSTLTLDALPEGSLLICNEFVWQRAQILRENIVKWGSKNTIVTSCDTANFTTLGETFDLIVCDAPCSGEGMFRKDANAIAEWSKENVTMCVARQREILRNAWETLREGGLLVYSTCTFNRYENEGNVAWLMDEFGAELLESRRFMPHISRGEGLFMAALRKPGNQSQSSTVSTMYPDKKQRGKKAVAPTEVTNWLNHADSFHFMLDEKTRTLTAFPLPFIYILDLLVRNHIQILHAGIPLAVDKGNVHKGSNWQPLHALALSNCLRQDAFPVVELTCEGALAYLRLQTISLPASTPRGFVLLTYQSCPLGFVKNIGNRSNNLYPSEWRIRMNAD